VVNILNKIDLRSQNEKELFLKYMIIQDLVNIKQEQLVLLQELSLKRLILTLQLPIAIVLLNIISLGLLIIHIASTSELNTKIIWTLCQFIKEINSDKKTDKFSE